MGSPSLLQSAWIVKLSGSLAEWGPLIDWLKSKFAKNPVLADANVAALNAGEGLVEAAQ